jgi:hypothetical protein
MEKIFMILRNKAQLILLNAIPILVMEALIVFVQNDYLLTLLDIVVITIAFIVKIERKEIQIFFFGFFVMIISEAIFISTGVETFVRNSLFGLMPLWLPFQWGYCFVAIKRAIKILNL